MAQDYWFKPKSEDHGTAPTNWKGWAAMLGYAVATIVITLPLIVLPLLSGKGPDAWQIALWLVLLPLVTGGFICLCRLKSDGDWRWRWRSRS